MCKDIQRKKSSRFRYFLLLSLIQLTNSLLYNLSALPDDSKSPRYRQSSYNLDDNEKGKFYNKYHKKCSGKICYIKAETFRYNSLEGESVIMKRITETEVQSFAQALRVNEKSTATIEKYTSSLRRYMQWLNGSPVSKERLAAFRDHLLETLSAVTVNGILSAINTWLRYNGIEDCRVKLLKVQRRAFCSSEKELRRADYDLLRNAARETGNERLLLVIETLGSTGIRVSEIKYITVEAIQTGRVEISMKGKSREILMTGKLCKKLKSYAKKKGITSGEIFLSRFGAPLSRKRIWKEMKDLCKAAGVNPAKVFPHNLRHLFARSFYKDCKDIAKLADTLGHSNIQTTRIYLITSGEEHIRTIERLHLMS